MATGDLHTKFREDRSSGSRDMLVDRQTDRQTHRQTDRSQYPASLTGQSNNQEFQFFQSTIHCQA